MTECEHKDIRPDPAQYDRVHCYTCLRRWTLVEFIAWMQKCRELLLPEKAVCLVCQPTWSGTALTRPSVVPTCLRCGNRCDGGHWVVREPLVAVREITPPVTPNDSAGQDDCG